MNTEQNACLEEKDKSKYLVCMKYFMRQEVFKTRTQRHVCCHKLDENKIYTMNSNVAKYTKQFLVRRRAGRLFITKWGLCYVPCPLKFFGKFLLQKDCFRLHSVEFLYAESYDEILSWSHFGAKFVFNR